MHGMAASNKKAVRRPPFFEFLKWVLSHQVHLTVSFIKKLIGSISFRTVFIQTLAVQIRDHAIEVHAIR
jgi:hypothetical protein